MTYHQVHQDLGHHADSVNRAHASARAGDEAGGGPIKRISAGLDPDALDFTEQLQERIEEHLGYGLDVMAIKRLDGMLGGGRPLDECVAVTINDVWTPL